MRVGVFGVGVGGGNGGTDEKPNMRHSQKKGPLLMRGTFEEERKSRKRVCVSVRWGERVTVLRHIMSWQSKQRKADRTGPLLTHTYTHT